MLRGNRILLRPLTVVDVGPLCRLLNDPANHAPHIRFRLHSPAALRARLQQNNGLEHERDRFTLAVTENTTATLIGTVHVHPLHVLHPIPEVGVYIYPPQRRRQGRGFEATALTVNFLFDTRPIPKVSLLTNAENRFLIPALQRFGWKKEAVLRRACFYSGAHQDYLCHSLLRPQWETLKDHPDLDGLF